MINICIVEDELDQAKLLQNYIRRFGLENKTEVETFHLTDGIDLVDDYQSQYDIILLDIQMKHLDGMTAAEKIRAIDPNVIIIFITSTVKYAVQGYAVDALGYVLKPVTYPAFAQLISKAIVKVQSMKSQVFLMVTVDDRQLRLDCSSIYYLESSRNNVVLHCSDNDFKTAGPLKKYEEKLIMHGFSKCHNAYIVNLSYVQAVQKEEVILTTGVILPISRARKKEFMAALAQDML